jgi:hypothetical protein
LRVRADDAGVGREEAAGGDDLRLERTDLSGGHHAERDAVPFSEGAKPPEFAFFRWTRCGDDLCNPPVGYVVTAADPVQETVSLDAEPCFQRAVGVVDTRMDHLAVPARGLLSVLRIPLEHVQGCVSPGKLCGDGKPDGTPADDCESGIRHSGSLHDVR